LNEQEKNFSRKRDMPISPEERYEEQLENKQIEPNQEQASVVDLLQETYQLLMERSKSSWIAGKKRAVKGIYLWGEVGAGKTYLLELLYQSVTVPKLRQHYHVFMQDVQQQLFAIQGTKNPLQKIAKNYAKKYRVFFLDEFIVNDICNAMVLAGLLEALFENGICLITTSNIVPDRLYEYGFQREQFLPAIEQIKNNTEVVNLRSKVDYRRAEDHTHENYLSPLSPALTADLKKLFDVFNQGKNTSTEPWVICGRSVPVVAASEDSAWFDFNVLCQPPRSQLDYIEISHRVKHLFLSNLPILNNASLNQASLLIKLIDVLYDEGIKLTVTAAAPIDELYPEGNLTTSFERTRSRIIEMCS
jgi:cell division protein ZapE